MLALGFSRYWETLIEEVLVVNQNSLIPSRFRGGSMAFIHVHWILFPQRHPPFRRYSHSHSFGKNPGYTNSRRSSAEYNCQDSRHDSPDNIGYHPTSLSGNLLVSFSLIPCLPGWLSSLLHHTCSCILFLWGINNIQTTKNCQPSMPRTTAYWFLTCLPDILRYIKLFSCSRKIPTYCRAAGT